jgi:hypothetical protein
MCIYFGLENVTGQRVLSAAPVGNKYKITDRITGVLLPGGFGFSYWYISYTRKLSPARKVKIASANEKKVYVIQTFADRRMLK